MKNNYSFLPGNNNNRYTSRLPEKSSDTNSNGYRAPEFNSVDWGNSIVLFGCSVVYGIGVNVEETISSQLENITNLPVINMGVPASSILYSLINQLKMYEQGIRPYAVVNFVTSTNRLTYFSDDDIINLGPWLDNKKDIDFELHKFKKLFEIWNLNDSNPQIYNDVFLRLLRIIWKDTRYLEYTFFPHTAKELNLKHIKSVDFGSDNDHFGPLTCLKTAEIIKEDLWSHLSDSN